MAKRGRGRPPKPASERLSEFLRFRCRPPELAAWNAAAKKAKLDVEAWAKQELNRVAGYQDEK